jgi:purine catabolism regulator
MKIVEAQARTVLGKARVVAGKRGLSNEIHWAHIVDMPEIVPWVRPGQLLLTTGYSLPRDPDDQRSLIRSLVQRQLAGIGLAVPRFFEHFPAPFCEEADLLGLPLLEIPWEIPFALITEELHTQILAEQSRLIEQSEIIHRSLTRAASEANSIQDLAITLGELIHRAVSFEDHDGHVLGYYTIQEMEDKVRRASLQEGQSPLELETYLTALGYSDAINRAVAPLRIPPFPEFGFSGRIVCPIRLKGEFIGKVWIIEGDDPLSDLDLRAAEHAALIAALQIAHQRAMASLEARVGYSFLSALLEGRFEATPQSIERAQLQGFDLEGDYRVGLLVMAEEVPLSHTAVVRREALADKLRQEMQRLGIPPFISVSLNQIPFLLPAAYDATVLWNSLPHDDVSLGMSRQYHGVQGVRDAYLEVLAMLPHLSTGELTCFENLLMPRVLMGDVLARTAYLDEVFGPLRRVRNGETLITTLIKFVQSDFRLRRTAEQLHIHPKSLKYRLQRIAKITDIDFHEPDTRFRLSLATKLLSL